ncbi:MAG: AAA family ATPase [Saprospiraceae bacterium]
MNRGIKRVVLTGPESTGKTFLSQKLAAHYHTTWVEEYGRAYCEKVGQDLTPLDFAHIAAGQIYLEDEAAKKANKILICDTDLIVTEIWAEIYKVDCPDWIIEENHRRHYDLFLLLAPDVAWERDGLREYPHIRDWHFERLKSELERRKVPLIIISGSYEKRMEKAVGAIDKLLAKPAMS